MNTEQVAWIVKTALMDETIPSDQLIKLMKENGITSTHLLNYIDEDAFWPLHQTDTSKISTKDEKYIINFKNPEAKRGLNALREKAREAVHQRFYTGHKFGEWDI
jgi:hypothetical protein